MCGIRRVDADFIQTPFPPSFPLLTPPLVLAHLAAMAVATNRVFVWGPDAGSRYTSAQSICAGKPGNWECFFQPPSDCKFTDNADPNATQKVEYSFGPKFGANTPPPPPDVSALPGWDVPEEFIPPVVIEKLRAYQPDMTPAAMKYWWRAQSVAYLMRFNDETIAAIWALRQRADVTIVAPAGSVGVLGGGGEAGGAPGAFTAAGALTSDAARSALLPLPRGSISAHVRHGDKGTEMDLIPWSGFVTAAGRLVDMNPLSLRHSIFVSSEDPGVLAELVNLTAPWGAVYSQMARANGNGVGQLHLQGNLVHYHFLQVRVCAISFVCFGALI